MKPKVIKTEHDYEAALARIEKLKTLTYTNAGNLCFADLYCARGYLDYAEFNRFVETLSAVPASSSSLITSSLAPPCSGPRSAPIADVTAE